MNVVLITGGSGLIGASTVNAFLESGYEVLNADLVDNESLTKESGYSFLEFDIRSEESIEKLTKVLAKENRCLQHLVSIAGGAIHSEFYSLSQMTLNDIKQSIELNLVGHIQLVASLKPLLEGSSCSNKTITLVSSINAILNFGLPAYSAAKSGLLGFVRVAASEFGFSDIRVNSVVPGTVVNNSRNEPKDYSQYLKGSSLNRFSTPQEVAETILLLADRMTAITGQGITVDCGQSISGTYRHDI
ncbi:MAG: SDR family oxidoreductase [Bacteroidia bacterium]